MKPRVYVIDDDEAVRTTLTLRLQAEFDVMCFATARHFIEVASALGPGCLLLDVYMPEVNGLEVQAHLTEKKLYFPTVMMTGQGDVRIAVAAMKAGAVDFIEKPLAHDELLESIHGALSHLTPATGSHEVDAAAVERLAQLSPREIEVLCGLVAGLPNKTVAYDLGISARTVEAHRARIMEKTQTRSFSALVRLALLAGIEGRHEHGQSPIIPHQGAPSAVRRDRKD